MTALKMHWQLIQGADGRPHLKHTVGIGAARLRARLCTHANSPKCKAKIGKPTDLVRCSA
jgi:hypothetical protein